MDRKDYVHKLNHSKTSALRKFIDSKLAVSYEDVVMREAIEKIATPHKNYPDLKIKMKKYTHAKRIGCCHDYTFDKWMKINKIDRSHLKEKRLSNNFYCCALFLLARPVKKPKPQYLCVYGTLKLNCGISKEEIFHSGIVCNDTKLIKSKWGVVPAIFEHYLSYVPSKYGDNVFYLKPPSAKSFLETINNQNYLQHVRKFDETTKHGESLLLQGKIFFLELNPHVCVDVRDDEGRTPLILATHQQQKNVIQILLDHGANVNAFGNDGKNPLTIALEKGNLDIVNLLISSCSV